MSGELTLEICVDTPEAFNAAIAGGADRIELCSALALGGLTPTPGLMAYAKDAPIPVYALIRPRDGNFVFSRSERAVMQGDIQAAKAMGLAGVVLGASLADGRLDETTLRELIADAEGLGLGLHRAFDLVPDMAEALELAVSLGFEHILTSGGAAKAPDGLDRLADLVTQAAGRISILPGSGINKSNAAKILARTGAHELHASCRTVVRQPEAKLVDLGFATVPIYETRPETVIALKASMMADPNLSA
ncbi:MAG TPA: copper homeostasis protein CutC [Arsenicitalea sp.]|jgi:copper homeostasis protein|nr:copper homeostasis protein CutC [Arsenicitalea sp.]